jgi:hypothetical protein
MDDFNVSSLHESKNEWGARLLTILTPLIIDGYKSILEEAVKLCRENGENEKYLMTFQNFVSRIPKWNPQIIENERKRIVEKSGCAYLEDLITCVHIIQLKILTAMRVGQKQKKIDINIPKLDDFVHKVYVHVARKVYKNVYLFELNIPPLQIQKHNRELEVIVQECILNTVRDSIPVEAILKAYMDETVEEDVIEEVKEQYIDEPVPVQEKVATETPKEIQSGGTIEKTNSQSKLSFNDTDFVRDENDTVHHVEAPKTIERLEEISAIRNMQRKQEEEEENGGGKLNISTEPAELGELDVHVIGEPEMNLLPDLLLDEIEVLE